jgi:hypothetical protein
MTTLTVPDSDADVRWRDWIARGTENDVRTTRRMTGLLLLIAIGLGLSLSVTLVAR